MSEAPRRTRGRVAWFWESSKGVRLFGASLVAGLVAAGCGGAGADDAAASEREVVLYVSADPHVYERVVAAFEDEHGIDVLVRTDTEATKTTGLVERLRAERDDPQADVFWSSEVFLTVKLAEEGTFAAHHDPELLGWPVFQHGERGEWYGFGLRARVAVYNTQRVAEADVPRTMHDLLDPKFKGRIAMARPEFGTTRGHVAAMLALWGEGEFAAWLAALEANGVRLYDGNSSVVRAVAMGEADVGLTDTDDVWSGQENGWSVEASYVGHELPNGSASVGPLVIPNTVAIVAGGPNPAAAELFAGFLLSERVEHMLLASVSHNVPVGTPIAAGFEKYALPLPAQVSYAGVAEQMDRALDLCDEHLK